ncbi:MAG: DUF72 domain-containing protein [Candidatus Riflebacteria bacterium]|nr:DUF72 domain-containing protein [Candidatus Riflebacteria bacterium]
MNLYIGTCSWADKSLLKSRGFYSPETKTPEQRLAFYCKFFQTVEIDSSFYAIPKPETVSQWAKWTPEGFIFHVKAYGAFTGHPISKSTLPIEVRNELSANFTSNSFVIKNRKAIETLIPFWQKAFEPLFCAKKLFAILLQFSPKFSFSLERLNFLKDLKKYMNPFPISVEFRNSSWLNEINRKTVFDFLTKESIHYVIADEPNVSETLTIPFVPISSTDTAIFRLHGRNSQNWFKKGLEASLRYDYDYSDEELFEFIEEAKEIAKKVKRIFVMFNNCHQTSAVKNAQRFQELLIGSPDLQTRSNCSILL